MRTHFCGLVDETLIGQTVTLAGWTDVARNLGGVCFIDLRDHEGIVQVTVEPVAGDDASAELFKVAASLGYEDVLQVEGVVRARHAVNDKLRTGKVEVIATRISILNKAAPLPFHAHENPGEETRLKYRYLDLRRPEMQRMQRTRIKLVQALRRHWTHAISRTSKPDPDQGHPGRRTRLRCRRACIRASSTPCRRARSCSSRS